MISLEQIKILDEKVKSAVAVIDDLRSENSKLKQKLENYQTRIDELERLIEDFKRDQGAIEQGILDAIDQLDHLESSPASVPVPEQPEEAESEPAVSTAADTEAPAETDSAKFEESPEDETAESSPSRDEKPGFFTEEEDPDNQETNELDIF